MVSLRSHLAGADGRCVRVFGLTLLLLATAFAFASKPPPQRSQSGRALLESWLSSHTNLHSWSAEFVQTRKLRTLAQPLETTGRVWFAEPNRFRWELGEPIQTVALREPEQLWVIYPRLERAERYPVGADRSGPWREALTLIEAGFPRSLAQLESKFEIAEILAPSPMVQVKLHPRARSARKLMPELTITFDPKDATLRATEIRFADGSVLRNAFRKVAVNPELDQALFRPAFPESFQIVSPIQRR